MTAALHATARVYLKAREAHQQALAAAHAAAVHKADAEKAFIASVMNTGDEDSGTAVVVDGLVLWLPEEFWDRKVGEQICIERLAVSA